jgi:(R,R)-butanediol dehydrogenase/meso-butanediol dehydrogenase/diacetyl reductase
VGLNISVEAARDRGTVVQAGRVIRRRSSTRDLAYENITIDATWCYEITMRSRVIRMISSGKLSVEKIITGRIEPEAIVDTGSARCSIRRQRDEGDG